MKLTKPTQQPKPTSLKMPTLLTAVVALAALSSTPLLPTTAVAHSQAAGRSMTVDDVLAVVRIEAPVISPDGTQVVFAQSELVWDENKRRSDHDRVDFAGGLPRRYLGDAGGEALRFAPDGSRVAMLREVDDESQIFLLNTAGGEAVQASRHAGGVRSYKWAADSSALYFVADEQLDEAAAREHELGRDPVFVDEGPNGKDEARYSNLWLLDLANSEERRLTRAEHVVVGFDPAADGRVAIVARPDRRTNYPFHAELYLYDPNDPDHSNSGGIQRITNNLAPEEDPLWSPDGRTLLYRAASDQDFDLRSGYFWTYDAASGETRRLEAQRHGRVDGVVWSADGRYVLFNENLRTDTNLYRLDVARDEAVAVTDRRGTLRARAYSRDRRRVVVAFEDFTTPSNLYALELGDDLACAGGAGNCELVQLTDANPNAAELSFSEGALLQWTSKGGMEIEGVFLPALDAAPNGGAAAGGGASDRDPKTPMILDIHGGPAGVVANRFDPEYQMLAGLGYAVLAPNFRGSSGYGDEVLRGLMGEVGDGEYQDLMTGVDHVLANPDLEIDPDRLGVRGWSWGGVSSSYVITQTERFKAASVGAMVGNWAAETGPGFNFDVSLWYIGSSPWDDPEEWAKRSSITHVRNVTTPTSSTVAATKPAASARA